MKRLSVISFYVLKSIMEFIDVLFPLNLGPLTYRCPGHLVSKAMPGTLISAPLKNQTIRGIILGESESHVRADIKSISGVHGESPLLEASLLKLLAWMSDYYIVNKGLVLKNMLPREAFKKVRRKDIQKIEYRSQNTEDRIEVDEVIISRVNESLARKEYKTFLLHAPDSLYELSFITKLLNIQKRAIILIPEIAHINHIALRIKEVIGDKLCVLHSGLSRGERSDAFEKILSGECTVVFGTRAAVFAPIKDVAMVIVIQEHSSSYKTEEGFRYNSRDIAVMRGYLEKATVVLSSICPSIESFYNAKFKKYSLLKPERVKKKPRITIVDMRYEKQSAPNLSKTVVEAAAPVIKKRDKVLFVINRKGYSMFVCRDCGYIEICDRCNIPLIFHKDDCSLRCHYCNSKSPSPEGCKRCGGFNIELAGAGIQRIEENIRKLFAVKPVRFDSDNIKKRARPEELAEILKKETVIVGTKLLTKRLHSAGEFGMAVVLNADSYLNLPDFRATEKAYHEIAGIADKIKPDGRLFIQTKMPENYLFRFLKEDSYERFCEEELSRRKELAYPPYSKLAVFTLKGGDYDSKVRAAIQRYAVNNTDLEILGPALSLSKKGQKEYSLLLKTSSKKKLNYAAKELLNALKGFKDLNITIAIDP
ncbi:MAG: primosomal protein N' [Nitrospirae bacterium]|nr:primosomal protein N' [Nitrospirota bacterium]